MNEDPFSGDQGLGILRKWYDVMGAFGQAVQATMLEDLRRLRKRVEIAGIDTARHQIVPRPFRR